MKVRCINAENTYLTLHEEYVVVEEYEDRYIVSAKDGQLGCCHKERFVNEDDLSIQLRNIDLSDKHTLEQFNKVTEELAELSNAIKIGTNDEVIEECLDVIQSLIGYIQVSRGIEAKQIMLAYDKHLEKLKNRPRD